MKIIYTKINDKYYVQEMKTNAIIKVKSLTDIEKDVIMTQSSQCKNLSIFLMVTNECNFTCKYCFEGNNSKLDCKFNIEQLISFLKKSNIEKYDKLEVIFTGGEPSLYETRILEIANKLNSTLDIKIEYSIITNGFILLHSALFNNIQVTLDGNETKHNYSRNITGGNDSYNIINRNIASYLERSIKVKLRVNIIDKDIDSYKELIDDIYQKYFNEIKKGLLCVYFDFLDIDSESDYYINDESRYNILKELYIYLLKKNIFEEIDYKSGMICMAKNNSSLTIDLDGNIYKCYSLVGEKCFSSGNIKESCIDEIKPIASICLNDRCPVYEKCYGGCPFENYIKNGKIDKICKKDYIYKMNILIFMLNLCKYGIIEINDIEEKKYHVEYKEI